MSKKDNKAVVIDFYKAIESGNWNLLEDMCQKDLIFYSQVDSPQHGTASFIESEKKNFDAIPGFTINLHDLIAENEKVVAYLIIEGIQSKEMLGISPTGAKLRFSLLNLFEFRDGKISTKRAHFDMDDIKRQLAKR